jgi:hypothetical protein
LTDPANEIRCNKNAKSPGGDWVFPKPAQAGFALLLQRFQPPGAEASSISAPLARCLWSRHAPAMAVDFIPAAHVRATMQRVQEARQRVLDNSGPPPAEPDATYWERLFEANAAEVLAALSDVKLATGYGVRYRFFGQRNSDLMVRPFVARTSTDVDSVRRLIDWHPPPDSTDGVARYAPTQDVELLYRHFSFPWQATGVFDYWVAMQELWASARWTHSHVIASAAELSQLTAGEGWEVLHPVETYEPAVVLDAATARLAVLVECPLRRFEISLQQIDIGADREVRYADPVLVAAGPRGYVL